MSQAKKRPTIVGGSVETYPVLPLRDIVVFPHMVVPLFVGREKSIRALEEVVKREAREFFGIGAGLGIDELQLAAALQYERRAGLGTHRQPQVAGRRLEGAVGFDCN